MIGFFQPLVKIPFSQPEDQKRVPCSGQPRFSVSRKAPPTVVEID